MATQQAVHKAVLKIVKTVLKSRFHGVDISSVEITPDADEDGDQFLAVRVVFVAKEKRLDASEVSGLVRRILPEMEKIGENRFPIFSFIAKSEMGKANPDSA